MRIFIKIFVLSDIFLKETTSLIENAYQHHCLQRLFFGPLQPEAELFASQSRIFLFQLYLDLCQCHGLVSFFFSSL